MGVNWQWSNPIPPTECVGFVREFHDWSNDQNDWEHWEPISPITNELTTYPNQCFGFNPPNSGAIDYDYFYTDMIERNLVISPAMTNSLRHYRGYETGQDTINMAGVGDIFRIPVKWTFNGVWESPSTTDATSYIDRSDWIYNFVARYGSNMAVDTDNLKYCNNEVGAVGQGQITYIESWNEPNKDGVFGDEQSDFSPEEYATMANLDFDGDDGIQDGNNTKLMGLKPATDPNAPDITYQLGINTLDPNMRYVMGGTVNINGIWNDWIIPMRTWFIDHRDDGDDFPFDVLNFHHYSVSGQNSFTDYWISPERDEFRVKMADLVNKKNTEFGGAWAEKEIWLSEFGYDTNELDNNGWDFAGGPDSPTDHFSVETLQAQWTLRSYLELAASGIDRAIVHDLRDGSSMPEANWDKHTGLLNTDDEPKKAWFYVYTMKNILEGYNYFDDSQSNSTFTLNDAAPTSGAYRVYQFKNQAGQSVWAVWSPTNSDVEISVTITLSNNNGATGFRPSEPSIHGVLEELTVSNGQVTVLATETPIFIVEEERTAPGCPQNITANVTCNAVDLEFDIPEGEMYETYQLWFGPTSSISDPNTPNFAALDGNGMNFQQNIPGNQNCLTIAGLDPGVSYYVYIIPENENGIPVDAQGNIQYCFTTVTTSTMESVCGIDMNDNNIVNIFSNIATPGFTDGLFDEQDLDFCQTNNPIPSSTPWVNFNDQAMMEIEFLQNYYIIDQLHFYDASSSGVFLVEGSVDGNVWTELTEIFTSTLNGWRTESNFEQPGTGIKFLRLTAQSDRARLTELFICGRPVCPIGTPTATLTCSDADFSLGATGTECAIASELTIQGNSGIETHPVNRNTFNYPESFFVERGSNQLIPGVAYAPVIETCSGTTCTTQSIPFTTDEANCILDRTPIITTEEFLGSCGGYTLPVNIDPQNPQDADIQVQLWLSHTTEFDDVTEHPLVQDSNAEMMILTVEDNNTIGNSISFTYDHCESNVYLAYRYFTADESSPLFTLSLVTSSAANNLAWYAICGCTGPNTPTPTFTIKDCYITDVSYDYLQVGERLLNEEYAAPSFGSPQRLKRDVYHITNSKYVYHLSYPEAARSLRFKVKETDPWTSLDLAAVPCMTTNDPPNNASQKEDTRRADLEVAPSLRLYPNPTRNYLNVEIVKPANLLLMGVDGKTYDLRDLRTTSYGYRFSTSHLTPGLYLLRTIDQTGKVQTGKFLIRK